MEKKLTIREAAKAVVARDRAKQGLPSQIQDPGTIARVVALLEIHIDSSRTTHARDSEAGSRN